MCKDKEIIYCVAECLEQSIKTLKELSIEYDWDDQTEFTQQLFMMSIIGYVITHQEHKEELNKFLIKIGKDIQYNNNIINQAKHYANITKN